MAALTAELVRIVACAQPPLALLLERRFWGRLCLGIYGLWCLILIASGNGFTFGLALVPALSLPAIGWLAWWLVYKEFHH